MEWYYRRGGNTRGPVQHDTMCRMVADGRVPRDAYVWRDGYASFVPLDFVEGFRTILAAPPPVPTPAPAPGAAPPPDLPSPAHSKKETVASFAGGQLLRTDRSHMVPDVTLASRPWLRLFARWLDGLLFALVGLLVYPQVLLLPILGWHLLYLPLAWIVTESFFISAIGATPGKLLLGICVLRADGRRLNLGQALRRSLDVYVRGQGLRIPIVEMFACVVAWGVLTADGSTTWDTRGRFAVRHARVGVLRTALVLLLTPCAILFVFGMTATMRPDWAAQIDQSLATPPEWFPGAGTLRPAAPSILDAPVPRRSTPARKEPPERVNYVDVG